MYSTDAFKAMLAIMALVVGCGEDASGAGGASGSAGGASSSMDTTSSATVEGSTSSGSSACATGTWDDDGDPSTACVVWTPCTAGQHVDEPGSATSDQTCKACESGTFTLATNATSCDAWTTCEPGEHIAQPGSTTKDRVCMACAAGTYSSSPNQSTCTPAGMCAAGTVQATPATPTSPPVCNTCNGPGIYCAGGDAPAEVCATGAWDEDMSPASACIAWTDCIAGQHVDQSGTALSDQTCIACQGGTFSAATNAPLCSAWTNCIAGEHIGQNGTAKTDRACLVCANGTFSTSTNAASCTAWSNCPAGQRINFPGSTSANRTCTACANGTFSASTNAASCAAWTDCVPGQRVNQAGSATTNRTCVACSSGTFSATTNATTCPAWTTCPPGQIEGTPGTATSDRVCVPYWPDQFGTSAYDYGAGGVGIDANGNVFVAGTVGGALPGQTYAGGSDVFIRKYAPSSAEIWTLQFGTGGEAEVDDLAIDASGSVIIVGYVSGALPGQTAVGGADAFVRKVATDGTELWTRQFGTIGDDYALGVALDASGNVFIAGAAGYGGAALPGQTSAGGADAFVREYAPDGTELLTKQFGTSTNDVCTGVGVDLSGNILLVGDTKGAFPGQTHVGGVDVFARKLASDGTEIWIRQFGSTADDYGYGMATDMNGDIFAVGAAYGAIPGQTYGGGTAGDAFVRKYGPDGSVLWTRQFGTTADEVARTAVVDANYNLFIGGYTTAALPGQTSFGFGDAFVREYSSSGSVLWTNEFGSAGWDEVREVCLGPSSDIFAAGYTGGALPGQTSAGDYDAFITRLVHP